MPEIIFTGDLMCRPSMTEKTNQKYDIFFEKTDFSLRSADFTVGNLETPVAGEKLKYTYDLVLVIFQYIKVLIILLQTLQQILRHLKK